eukprot:6154486-Prymnesium_polylepis.1
MPGSGRARIARARARRVRVASTEHLALPVGSGRAGRTAGVLVAGRERRGQVRGLTVRLEMD